MLGAIAGDIIGSRFEHNPVAADDFALFAADCRFTDDTVLTCATADALLHGRCYADAYRQWFRRYPDAGYGARFVRWGMSDDAGPYNSYGNGSAMRVSPVGWLGDDLAAVLDEAAKSAAATHDHPEGIRGAQAVAAAVLLARKGEKKSGIKEFVETTFNYDLDRRLADIRPGYGFDVTCQGSVPEALICFLEADSFEQAVRNAVLLGGDADTQAAIAGAVAEAYWGVPDEIGRRCRDYLAADMRELLEAFERRKSVGRP
ncbi:ADP-ribosylglycohydrolase [Geothermobacter ehrlichii]|uniref:ADP-ribosylglycohydrolase n=1 Tax=Geothermobacter ehrlichii TaxID=213224 RepID=A0A5D3WMT6_9BACT|nr:ADP-ribosylglycohydrolase family protein [Geothermobacter ehrlichii]TYO99686.1 ADP-ribosylglycohydrolase [Geothermobacter ehrlichii]